ncbi:MAG: DHHW family protein [Bacteroidota bacterium]
MTNNKFRVYFISTIFIVIISFPLINSRFSLIKDIPSNENRKMASKPQLNFNLLDPYPPLYEKYYSDNFTIRSLMIKYYNLLNIYAFEKSPIPDQVIFGKDGWLFLAGNELDAYRGKNSFNQKDLEEFKLELEYRKKYIENNGGKFYFMIAPNKANIYSNKMPNNIFKINNQSWGEQLIEYLNLNSNVKPIDISNALINTKKENLYYKLDNHWTELGAFYASNEVLKRIHLDFPKVNQLPISDYDLLISDKTHQGNIANMLSNLKSFKEFEYKLVRKPNFKAVDAAKAGYKVTEGFPYSWDYENVKEIIGSKNPKILIISDSFGYSIFPFISEEFSRSVKIFDAWQYKLNEEIIQKEKPDIVLLITVEPLLKNILKYQSRLNIK